MAQLEFIIASDSRRGLCFTAQSAVGDFVIEKTGYHWVSTAELRGRTEQEICETYTAAQDWCNDRNVPPAAPAPASPLLAWEEKYRRLDGRSYTEYWAIAPDKKGIYQVFEDTYSRRRDWQAAYLAYSAPDAPCWLEAHATICHAQAACEAHAAS